MSNPIFKLWPRTYLGLLGMAEKQPSVTRYPTEYPTEFGVHISFEEFIGADISLFSGAIVM